MQNRPETTQKTVDTNTDQELIDQFNHGRVEAFEELYERHKTWVFRMSCRITEDAALADDVAQEVFCYWLKKFPGFKLTCQLKSFLYPVVRNLSLTAIKKKRRYDSSENAQKHLYSLPDPQDETTRESEIFKQVEKLETKRREVLLMRFVDGMTIPEIAEVIGVPLGTVKSRLHHAIKTMKTLSCIKELKTENERFDNHEHLTSINR